MDWTLFAGMDSERTREVLAMTRRRRFDRGTIVFHEGDPGDTVHLIERGHLAVRVTTPLGESATLRVLGAGDYVGELALVDPAPRSATVVALELSETLTLHRDQLDRLRRDSPEVDRVLLAAAVREVRRLSAALLDVMYLPVAVRLSRQLLVLAAGYPADANGRSVLPLTQDDLAGLCGTTRPTVNQILGSLAAKGAVDVARGRVIITDVPRLQRLAR